MAPSSPSLLPYIAQGDVQPRFSGQCPLVGHPRPPHLAACIPSSTALLAEHHLQSEANKAEQGEAQRSDHSGL